MIDSTAAIPDTRTWRTGLPESLVAALGGPKIPALDGMRAMAAWAVVGYHLQIPGFFGIQAVEFFFVLSGFLITWLLLAEEERHGTANLRAFYIRRSLRIFPPFYAYWLVSIAVLLVTHGPLPWGVMWAAFFYVSNWYHAWRGVDGSAVSHCWSLGLEEQYYLLWPLAFVWLHRHGHPRLRWVGLAIVAIWLRRLDCVRRDVAIDYIYHAFDTRADAVLVGTWTAIALRTGHLRGLMRVFANHGWLTPVVAVALWRQFGRDTAATGDVLTLQGLWIEPLLFMALLLLVLMHHRHVLLRWLDTRVMRHLGMLSYSTYLWHQLPVAGARYRLATWDPTLRFVVTLAAVVALSHLSFYVVERPALRWKSRFGV